MPTASTTSESRLVTRSLRDHKVKPPRVRANGDGGKERGKAWRDRISIAALIAVIALLTGSVDLAYRLWPSLKKDPGNEHAADIAVLTMDKNVSYGNYRLRPGATPPPEGTSGNDIGNVIYLQMQTHGFKGSRARLRWFTYNADNGDRLPRPFSTGHKFRAKAPSNKSISQEWVPLPPHATGQLRKYRIRFELYDSDDALLAYDDSEAFTVAG